MGVGKQEIRERLRTYSVWVTNTHTRLSDVTYSGQLDTGLSVGDVPERMMRYVVGLYINGNQQIKTGVEISVLDEGGTEGTVADHTVKFSDINVPAADNVQIPNGELDLEDIIIKMVGGERGPYARTNVAGHSVNLTVMYWDSDI